MMMRDLLSTHPFLAGLPGRDLDRLSYWSRRAVFHAGRRVFEAGGRADRFWLIREGEISVNVPLAGGAMLPVQQLGEGDALGWSWLAPPHRWRFSAIATQTTLAIDLDAHGVRGLCDSNPLLGYELHRRFHQVMVDRLNALRDLAVANHTLVPDRELAGAE